MRRETHFLIIFLDSKDERRSLRLVRDRFFRRYRKCEGESRFAFTSAIDKISIGEGSVSSRVLTNIARRGFGYWRENRQSRGPFRRRGKSEMRLMSRSRRGRVEVASMPPRYGSLPVTSNLFHVSAFEPSPIRF